MIIHLSQFVVHYSYLIFKLIYLHKTLLHQSILNTRRLRRLLNRRFPPPNQISSSNCIFNSFKMSFKFIMILFNSLQPVIHYELILLQSIKDIFDILIRNLTQYLYFISTSQCLFTIFFLHLLLISCFM